MRYVDQVLALPIQEGERNLLHSWRLVSAHLVLRPKMTEQVEFTHEDQKGTKLEQKFFFLPALAVLNPADEQILNLGARQYIQSFERLMEGLS
jgi:hypothetical protein